MFAVFQLAGIEVEISVDTVYGWNDPPHEELTTRTTATIEGYLISHTSSTMIDDYATQKDIQELFNAECAKYSFMDRK